MKTNKKSVKKALTDYWLAFYVNPLNRLCSLCGNSGKIDTRQTAISAAGINAGQINFCICPNGQAMRYHSTAKIRREEAQVEVFMPLDDAKKLVEVMDSYGGDVSPGGAIIRDQIREAVAQATEGQRIVIRSKNAKAADVLLAFGFQYVTA